MGKPVLEKIFQQLQAYVRETSYLVSTAALLEWDQQTYLPARAGAFRSEQLTWIAGEIHQRQTDAQLGNWLNELAASPLAEPPHSDHATTIRKLKRTYDRQVKMPLALVQALAKATALGHQVWVQARKDNDFSAFAPSLKEVIRLKQEQADAIGFQQQRYDALLDEYEPAATTLEVATVLANLRVELVDLIQQINDSPITVDTSILNRQFPVEHQRNFGREASSKIGFNYQRGRLDVTHHPFCTEMGPNDCRITTRYDENFFSSAFFGTLHEAGHGIYEQGLRQDQYGLPPGQYCSLGIHESQSRLWENLVGRSQSFWQHFFPAAQKHFPDSLGSVSFDQFYAAINAVSPSLIRVEADEATYNLHIIIRFELEQALIDGDLLVDDLPSAWDEKYQHYLGIKPPDAATGVLQDVHWSAGLIGYFPTYTLGNLYASQFFDAAEHELGNLDELFAQGEYKPLTGWLNDQVHNHGQCYSAQDLATRVTGAELSHQSLMRHLSGKLGKIYQLN